MSYLVHFWLFQAQFFPYQTIDLNNSPSLWLLLLAQHVWSVSGPALIVIAYSRTADPLGFRRIRVVDTGFRSTDRTIFTLQSSGDCLLRACEVLFEWANRLHTDRYPLPSLSSRSLFPRYPTSYLSLRSLATLAPARKVALRYPLLSISSSSSTNALSL